MRYTIEARALSNENTRHSSFDAHPRRTVIEASDPNDAISQFLRQDHSELISSLAQPAPGRESIATVKKDDRVFLVRVYAA